LNKRFKNLSILPALIAGVGLMQAGRVTALTYSNVYTFAASGDGPNLSGRFPVSSGILYDRTIKRLGDFAADK
jgi:hypothetical protein